MEPTLDLIVHNALAALQALVTFRTLGVVAASAAVWWLLPIRARRYALIPLSLAVLLLGYERTALLPVAVAVVAGVVHVVVRAGLDRRVIVGGLVALYAALHGALAVMINTPLLDWTGLTPGYVVPTIGLTAAFTFLRLAHFAVDFGRGGKAVSQAPPPAWDYLTWCLFFPTFVHLPFVKVQVFRDGLAAQPARPGLAALAHGARRVGQALLKGAIAAAILTVFQPYAALLDPAAATPPGLMAAVCLAAAAYYFGFSGFADLSVGVGRWFGFSLPETFAPFGVLVRTRRVRDFWRNWNLTTAAWLVEYVYQPLGGFRRHPLRNTMLTMIWCGLWHSFGPLGLAWGAGLGAMMVVEHWLNRWRIRRGGAWAPISPAIRPLAQPVQKAATGALIFACIALINLCLTPFAYMAGGLAGLARVLLRLAGLPA